MRSGKVIALFRITVPLLPLHLSCDNTNLQVASQQGTFLARLFSRGFEVSASIPQKRALVDSEEGRADAAIESGEAKSVPLSEKLGLSIVEGTFAKPFQFLNLGILAYTGAGGALAQVQVRAMLRARTARVYVQIKLRIYKLEGQARAFFALSRRVEQSR